MALSTPGGDNQDQALIQIFFDVAEFNMNAAKRGGSASLPDPPSDFELR